jgi:hypothetical protein
MADTYIEYKEGYKYQLFSDHVIRLDFGPHADVNEAFLVMTTVGLLTIKKGYAWDGPSGPTFDTENFMRGSLVHDALYQLIREEKFGSRIDEKERAREKSDNLLRDLCKRDGMSSVRAWWVYQGVRLGGGVAIQKPKEVIKARYDVDSTPSAGEDETQDPLK